MICCLLIFGVAVSAYADNEARVVVGNDLNDDQVAIVYNVFGIKRGSVTEFRMTNELEREYLEGYVDSSIIGTKSVSCVYLELKDDGSGMDVTTNNITWCTSQMYISALATAGITDAKIVVAAPFAVSGTSALTGIYWAYEDITGKKIDESVKLVSTQELTVTGDLAEEIGSMDASMIVDDLKEMLDYTANLSDIDIKSEIVEIAKQYGVNLTDKQIEQLISLCRNLESVRDNKESLLNEVQKVQNTINKVKDAETKVVGVVKTVKEVITSVSAFFDKISGIIGFDNYN